MQTDSNLKLEKLLVDGGMTKNDLLMQIQSDFLGKFTITFIANVEQIFFLLQIQSDFLGKFEGEKERENLLHQ